MTSISDETYVDVLRKARAISPRFGRVLERIGPIEIGRSPHRTVAAHLYRTVVDQQLSLSAARAIWLRIEALAKTEGNDVESLFVDSNFGQLRSAGISGRKARSLIAIREATLAGGIDEAALAGMGHLERSAVLCSIWGVGQWTADMIGIFYFRAPDIWPNGDVSATTTLQALSGSGDSAQTALSFSPYRSILARYMWRFRDENRVENTIARARGKPGRRSKRVHAR